MRRSLAKVVQKDLDRKIVILSGPRQSGKTTLSKDLFGQFDYFNYDYPEHRISMLKRSWDRSKELVVLDELHKMKTWKRYLKGIFDVEGVRPRLLVTGSARLEVLRKTGESLAGRFYHHRLHPLDVKEVSESTSSDYIPPEQVLNRMMRVGGFPEPFLENDVTFYNRWRRQYIDVILRQDVADLARVRDLRSLETLIELIRARVGSTVSHAHLANDLQVSPKTIQSWFRLLEDLYVVFSVQPYSRNIARSLLKAPKYYFYDSAQAENEGARFENIVAAALQKEIHRVEDSLGERTCLRYLRTKEGREIDFAVIKNKVVTHLVEVKLSDAEPSACFAFFKQYFPTAKLVQVVLNIDKERVYPQGVSVHKACDWLSRIDFSR